MHQHLKMQHQILQNRNAKDDMARQIANGLSVGTSLSVSSAACHANAGSYTEQLVARSHSQHYVSEPPTVSFTSFTTMTPSSKTVNVGYHAFGHGGTGQTASSLSLADFKEPTAHGGTLVQETGRDGFRSVDEVVLENQLYSSSGQNLNDMVCFLHFVVYVHRHFFMFHTVLASFPLRCVC